MHIRVTTRGQRESWGRRGIPRAGSPSLPGKVYTESNASGVRSGFEVEAEPASPVAFAGRGQELSAVDRLLRFAAPMSTAVLASLNDVEVCAFSLSDPPGRPPSCARRGGWRTEWRTCRRGGGEPDTKGIKRNDLSFSCHSRGLRFSKSHA